MRKTSIIVTAAAALLLVAVSALYLLLPSDMESAYKGFRDRVTKDAQRAAEAARSRQSAVPPPSEVTAIVGPYAKRCPGAIVVGLIDRRRQLVLGWGKDKSGRDANGDTLFETASVSKALTGLILAQMAESHKVELEEPVQDLLDVRIPTFDGQKLTLRQLATHSSGLPPWPDNRGDTTAPYSDNDLCCYLRQASLMGRPDSGVLYSNTAFALLGEVLARKEGTTFEDLLKRSVCTPLGMKNTQVGLAPSQRKHLAVGHWVDGSPAHPSAPTAGGGADGIRSTVHDLLKLASAYIGIQPTDFDSALRLSYKPYIMFNEKLDAALGWFVDTTDGTVEKSGKIAGYRTHISFSPDAKVGVVILAGWEAFPSPELGNKLLKVMMERRSLIESGAIIE